VSDRLQAAIARERERFEAEHPRSRVAFEQAKEVLLGGVPMSWMAKWPGGFPLTFEKAGGATLTDADGHTYIDFCLGDTGAMAGHSPDATVAAVERRLRALGGVTTMLPSADATWVGGELARRFGLPQWQFTLTATDANRFALRLCRQVTGRPKVLVFSYCYHGTVDETFVTLADGEARSRAGNVGPPVDPTVTTRVVEFNDLETVERELAHGDVACVLTEPALTNIGIVLPEPGFLDAVRAATRDAGTLLIVDETHTFSAGAGGCTRAWGLEPDVVTIGKSIGGGVPIGAFGLSQELARRVGREAHADYEDTGGVGGTLAGNALSLAAARATLEHVLTDAAFAQMEALARRFAAGVQSAFERHGAPWSVVRLGARAEYRFTPEPPRTGGASAAAADDALDEFFHLFLLNRGVLMTPFHNMALMCPATTEADVDRHSALFDEAVAEALSSRGR
jgi:glutamate-1-semialdehyde 2,1-aminomutase